MDDNENQAFDLGSALARIGNIPTQDVETKLHQAAQDEGAAYRGRLAEEQPRAPETPSFGYGMVEPVTQPKAQPQPPYDYSAANLESGRNLSRQSFVDSYNKQAAAEPRVDTLNRFASSLAGRPASPYNANPSNYRQLTPSEEAEKYRREQEAYAGLAAQGVAGLPLAKYAPGPTQLQAIIGTKAPEATKSIDPLGYYSHALETAKALPQAKGTPEQMLAQLKKAGVKDAELQATGTTQFLEGKPSVTRDELVQHLEDNRVGLNKTQYGSRDEYVQKDRDLGAQNRELHLELGRLHDPVNFDDNQARIQEVRDALHNNRIAQQKLLAEMPKSPNWNTYSLDPNNPTYRETTLHLPPGGGNNYQVFNSQSGLIHSAHATEQEAAAQAERLRNLDPEGNQHVDYDRTSPIFQAGHFSEPNITGHLMTSMVEDNAGRKVFNVDQIQSDWGQKLREGGARDEAKIANLNEELRKVQEEELNARLAGASFAARNHRYVYAAKQLQSRVNPWDQVPYGPTEDLHMLAHYGPEGVSQEAKKLLGEWNSASSEQYRIDSERRTAESATSGHPLVNTTDQWTNTTLRHALRQAIESGADAISIPHGDTVLSYNPEGAKGPNGMRNFYGTSTKEGIAPKNLRKILRTYDPAHPGGQHVDTFVTPTRGETNRGNLPISDGGSDFGFTVFPLTDKIKKSVMEHGQPLFKRGGSVLRADGGSISDGTRALLAKVKRQDGGSALRDPKEANKTTQKAPGPNRDSILKSVYPNGLPDRLSILKDVYPELVPPSGSWIPKEGLQPEDPNLGSFRALGSSFTYNPPPDARESTKIEDRRFTHPSLPTSDFGNSDFVTSNAFSRPKPVPPTSAAGVQGMSGTQSGPSVNRNPWTANMTPGPFETQVISTPPFSNGGSITDRTRQLLAKLKNSA